MAALYNPNSTYGAPNGDDYRTSPISKRLYEQAPNVAFYDYMARQGVEDNDTAFSRYFRSQFPNLQLAYGAATAKNPYLDIGSFMDTLGGAQGFKDRFKDLAPQQRGEQASTWAPSVRTIRWS